MPGNRDANALFKIIERLHEVKDLDLLQEKILHESRLFVRADAGTLYHLRGGRLYFSFTENDSLFKEGQQEDKYVYMNRSIPVNTESIAGFVANTGQSLLVDDVYTLPGTVSYNFNPDFDNQANYRTKSILAVPLKSSGGEVLGVIQLINALDENGRRVAFSQQDRLYISYFAQHAALAMSKAEQSKEMVLRMAEIAQMRDPHESPFHVQRVGEYSLEIFDAYAKKRGMNLAERTRRKEAFRLGAMLHDIGKVGVDGKLLSLSRNFEDSDKETMYWHTVYGARLFRRRASIWEKVAYEVTLNHHERWDGNGYPGRVKNLFVDNLTFGAGKRNHEIPLSGRIVAIADVFDALVSARSYKEAWDFDTAILYVQNKANKQFDPELVELFLGRKSTIKNILNNVS